jgi:hypothetical protein
MQADRPKFVAEEVTEWTEPVELESEPVGLSVDQEIRARAAMAAAQMIAPAVASMVSVNNLPRMDELAGGAVKLMLRLADVIRDGQVPDA